MKKLLSVTDRMVCEQIRSFLAENQIQSLVKNEQVQTLFEPGELGSGYNLAMGSPEIWVDEKHLKPALELIDMSVFAPSLDPEAGKKSTSPGNPYLNSLRAAIFFFVWIFGIGNILGVIFAVRGLRCEPNKIFAVTFLGLNVLGMLGSAVVDFAIFRRFG